MTRKKFQQDLDRAKDNPPPHVANINRYDGDGISLTYWYLHGDHRREVNLKLVTTNVDEYPDANSYMLFTEDADTHSIVTDAFVQIEAIIDGASVPTALREISETLQQAVTLGEMADSTIMNSSNQAAADSDNDEFENAIDEEDHDSNFGMDDWLPSQPTVPKFAISNSKKNTQNAEAIKRDLRIAKDAGFKIGVHGDLSATGIVCISVRVTKLGISEEALRAWGLSRNEYLVVLIRFLRGYKFLSQVIEEATLAGQVEMRVGLCDTYKPNPEQASSAFIQSESAASSITVLPPTKQKPSSKGALKPLFIGRPLHDLLRERFTRIVKFRDRFQLSWSGAERLFNDRQGTLHSDLSKDITCYELEEDDASSRALPNIVMADTLSRHTVAEASLPLVAIEFVLRHFVRCTEFCLVCHCRIEATFEALKPYVCSNPLCLYQFLALGFGPAAEWEILSQPFVVDLLVSFCYSQARVSRMRIYPRGINIKVPVLPHYKLAVQAPAYRSHHPSASPQPSSNTPAPEPVKAFKAKLLPESNILTPVVNSWTTGKQSVSKGDWLVLVPAAGQGHGVYHCRIDEERGLEFHLSTLIHCPTFAYVKPAVNLKLAKQAFVEVDCYLYDENFDDLPDHYRSQAIVSLLDILPSVSDMQRSLQRQQDGHRDANLNLLRDQCPQAALHLLRWIIASNRSCIMQVDQVVTESESATKIEPTLRSSEDRVSGMDEWMQFRFAQGAPDKEQRFVDCVDSYSANKQYPTLFAWHGSPVTNWHSIIRHGLNFDEIAHGRASGHGVYMSPHVNTSLSYVGASHSDNTNRGWPNSLLKPSSVVSLQEVVNAPSSFVSRSPHFVVAEKDWIQTRYLFVKTNMRHTIGSSAKNVYKQDPQYTARDTKNEPVSIPITAIAKSRRPEAENSTKPKVKKRKVAPSRASNDCEETDEGQSVATDEDDTHLLNEDEDEDVDMTDVDESFDFSIEQPAGVSSHSDKNKKRSLESCDSFTVDSSKTDFVPGNLDTTGIRFLNPPSYASITASRALMRAFDETIKVQRNTPLHDLGFYIDPLRVENMYQWIVEMHSFDKTLPLAQDMKAAGITSIVFEMLFTDDFPFSPPFVRVVKPRFLDPMMGGGGHITSGGAICMELLTSTGWSAVNSMESVLLQVRLAMSERERPARLLQGRGGYETAPYAIGEAIAAFRRFCSKHGWQAPKGLNALQTVLGSMDNWTKSIFCREFQC